MNQADLRVAEDPEERKRHEVHYPYTAPQPSPAVQGDIPDVVDVPDQCPYFGPSPHRDVWLAGWYAARKQGANHD